MQILVGGFLKNTVEWLGHLAVQEQKWTKTLNQHPLSLSLKPKMRLVTDCGWDI